MPINIRISDEAHVELIAIQGEVQAKKRKRVDFSETILEMAKIYRQRSNG